MKSIKRVAKFRRFAAFLLSCAALAIAAPASAVPVLVPDNGGTAQLPILSDYVGQTPMQINAGLPPASTIDIAATLKAPLSYEEIPGGTLGGTSWQRITVEWN